MTWVDYIRLINICLFGLTIGEVAWIFRQYFRILVATRRLLPQHVVLISMAVIGFETEAVVQNVVRFGHEFSWYAPANLVLFTLVYVALFSMRRHLTRKTEAHKEILPLLQDPHDIP